MVPPQEVAGTGEGSTSVASLSYDATPLVFDPNGSGVEHAAMASPGIGREADMLPVSRDQSLEVTQPGPLELRCDGEAARAHIDR
jgi:hypothetical protein